jgi:hypothetical protein
VNAERAAALNNPVLNASELFWADALWTSTLTMEPTMANTMDDLLPKAADCRNTVAQIEGEKASEYLRLHAAKDAEKKALIDQFSRPSGVSEEERMKRAAVIINRAVRNGLTEVEVVFRISSAPIADALSISRSPAGKTRSPDCQKNYFNSGRRICSRAATK